MALEVDRILLGRGADARVVAARNQEDWRLYLAYGDAPEVSPEHLGVCPALLESVDGIPFELEPGLRVVDFSDRPDAVPSWNNALGLTTSFDFSHASPPLLLGLPPLDKNFKSAFMAYSNGEPVCKKPAVSPSFEPTSPGEARRNASVRGGVREFGDPLADEIGQEEEDQLVVDGIRDNLHSVLSSE